MCISGGPSALAHEPQRAGEVVQRDHRGDRLLAQLAEHVPVVADLPGIEHSLRGLDARPLDGQPVGVLVHLAEQREVLAVAVVVVVRDAGPVAIGDVTRLLLPLPPVAVAAITLHLVRGARRPPEKSLGEGPCHYAAAVSGLSTSGGGMYVQAIGLSPSISSCSIPALPIPERCISRSLCGRPSSRM